MKERGGWRLRGGSADSHFQIPAIGPSEELGDGGSPEIFPHKAARDSFLQWLIPLPPLAGPPCVHPFSGPHGL